MLAPARARPRLLVLLTLASILLATGCDPIVTKRFVIHLPVPTDRAGGSLVETDPEVQAAVSLTDSVMVTHGFGPNPRALGPEDRARGLIAQYALCGVSLQSDTLTIGCLQMYRSWFTPEARKAMAELETKLRQRYGSDAVTVID